MAWPPTNGLQLTRGHEGRTRVPYRDQFGYPTNGTGHKLSDDQTADLASFPVVDDAQIDAWFEDDYAAAGAECQRLFGDSWDGFADARQAAFIDMAFEMGETGLGRFHNMIAAAKADRWDDAAEAAANSLWDRQVPHRAKHDIALILTGDWGALTNV